VNHFRNIW